MLRLLSRPVGKAPLTKPTTLRGALPHAVAPPQVTPCLHACEVAATPRLVEQGKRGFTRAFHTRTGLFQNQTRQADCKACPANFFQSDTSRTLCHACAVIGSKAIRPTRCQKACVLRAPTALVDGAFAPLSCCKPSICMLRVFAVSTFTHRHVQRATSRRLVGTTARSVAVYPWTRSHQLRRA